MLQDIQTSQILPTIDFLYGRLDILRKDELNKDLLFDVFNSSFPCSFNEVVKTENEEKKIETTLSVKRSVKTKPSFDDMVQVEIKEENDNIYEDDDDTIYEMMDQHDFPLQHENQIIDDEK